MTSVTPVSNFMGSFNGHFLLLNTYVLFHVIHGLSFSLHIYMQF